MLGCVVPLQLTSYLARHLRLKPLVQHPCMVGVEIVRHQHNALCVGIVLLHQATQLRGRLGPSAIVSHRHSSPPSKGFGYHEHVSRTLSFIRVVWSLYCMVVYSGLHWCYLVLMQHLVRLVQAYHRASSIIRELVHVQHILHARYVLGIGFGYAQILDKSRLEFVFLSFLRTASSEMVSTTLSSIKRSAKSCIVQRLLPCGGVEQASMVRWASTSPVKRGGRPGEVLPFKAAVRPSSTKRARVRCTVEREVSRAWTISTSRFPLCASSSMRARVWTCARALPEWISCSSSSCCWSVSCTWYNFVMSLAYHHHYLPVNL